MPFERINQITGKVLEKLDGGRGDLVRLLELKAHWVDIVGASLADHLAPLRIKKDTLEVGASTPTWLNEARFFEQTLKENIARKMGQRYKRIRFSLLKRARVDARETPAPKKQRVRERNLSKDEIRTIEDMTKDCRDERLQERLRALFLKSARRIDQGPKGCKS